MNALFVLYDDHCGICSQLRRWLEAEATYLPLKMVPLHSPDLDARFPGVRAYSPEEKLVVVADDGSLWRGDSAWITLLWALVRGRELAFKLSRPALRPLARRVVTAVSANRLKLSRWLRFTPDSLPKETVCADGVCRL
jgi:predicted DCC family thiol-disulfide oxidoreductase YuxK